MKSLASWTEVAVGVSLIAIGVLGIKEAQAWQAEEDSEGSRLEV
jgi:F420-0:gamma-glutamyl ligase